MLKSSILALATTMTIGTSNLLEDDFGGAAAAILSGAELNAGTVIISPHAAQGPLRPAR